jgi:hypothetical protein
VRQGALTPHRARAAAHTADTAHNVGRRGVTAVTEPVGPIAGRACHDPRRFEPGEPPGHYVARLVVAWPAAELRRPGFVVPGDHRPIAIHADPLVNDVGLAVVLPRHFVAARELHADGPADGL